MQLLINIVPNETISWDRLFQLGAAIEAQRFAGVTTNLQLTANQDLTADHQAKLATLNITVQDKPQVPVAKHSYVLNLRENDVLLPGALAQWQSVTTQHAHTPISLATFDNQLPLDEQISDYLMIHANNSLLTTYHQLSKSDSVWPQMWGLQNYSVRSNLKNFRLFSQRLRPTGVLLPATKLARITHWHQSHKTSSYLASIRKLFGYTSQPFKMVSGIAIHHLFGSINFRQPLRSR